MGYLKLLQLGITGPSSPLDIICFLFWSQMHIAILHLNNFLSHVFRLSLTISSFWQRRNNVQTLLLSTGPSFDICGFRFANFLNFLFLILFQLLKITFFFIHTAVDLNVASCHWWQIWGMEMALDLAYTRGNGQLPHNSIATPWDKQISIALRTTRYYHKYLRKASSSTLIISSGLNAMLVTLKIWLDIHIVIC